MNPPERYDGRRPAVVGVQERRQPAARRNNGTNCGVLCFFEASRKQPGTGSQRVRLLLCAGAAGACE